MKPLFLACALLLSTAAAAAEVDPKLESAVRAWLPRCAAEATVTFETLQARLPPRFKGTLVKVESDNHACDTARAAVLSPTGGLYVGMPWNLADEEGATVADKLKSFVWRNFQMNATPVIEAKATADGLYNVTLLQATENGKLPLEGELDPQSAVFFLGHFRRPDDFAAQRLKAFGELLGKAPSRGPADARVTVVEFSDFECPSCRRSSGYADSLLARFDGKIRYIRFDMPLEGHPWAFPAALAGRAIHRQKPEAFWEYKKQVYANQDKLNAFMIWDWARSFAQEHELDLERYDADLASDTLKADLLKGAGLALSNDVHGTPTFMVNGAVVDAGDGGEALAAYIEQLLK